jgi:1-deoxy-D-xylulose-5-phosphate reductoisomerase
MAGDVCRLIVLGSTGSIGTQTLEVVGHLNAMHARGEWPVRYRVVGLAAGRNRCELAEQRREFEVGHAAIAGTPDPSLAEHGVRAGPDAAERLVREVECDLVVAAMSGSAGLPAALAAVELGRDVALANKEALVAAGELVAGAARKSGARLLPVDSEHSGVWQCLEGEQRSRKAAEPHMGAGRAAPPMCAGAEVARVVLTASGGPFRSWSRERMEGATPEEALKHPTWSMGPKVTVDSASLMNKALEVIEAHWLFGLTAERIGVVIHPQSIVHAMVEFADGSVMAQLAVPDMRTPIQHSLTWPRRAPGASRRLDWSALSCLDFEAVDEARFPAAMLGHRAIREGGTAGAVLNAANEAAVSAFLEGQIGFTRIAELVEGAMDRVPAERVSSLGAVLEADRRAREVVAAGAAAGG